MGFGKAVGGTLGEMGLNNLFNERVQASLERVSWAATAFDMLGAVQGRMSGVVRAIAGGTGYHVGMTESSILMAEYDMGFFDE